MMRRMTTTPLPTPADARRPQRRLKQRLKTRRTSDLRLPSTDALPLPRLLIGLGLGLGLGLDLGLRRSSQAAREMRRESRHQEGLRRLLLLPRQLLRCHHGHCRLPPCLQHLQRQRARGSGGPFCCSRIQRAGSDGDDLGPRTAAAGQPKVVMRQAVEEEPWWQQGP